MFYVYALRSTKDGQMYVGSTKDLKHRLKQHNNGDVFSTRPRRPLELVYYEAYKSEYDARMRESRLKLRSKAFVQLRKRIQDSLRCCGSRGEWFQP